MKRITRHVLSYGSEAWHLRNKGISEMRFVSPTAEILTGNLNFMMAMKIQTIIRFIDTWQRITYNK